MKVLQLNRSDGEGGAAKAAFRLFKALRLKGVDAEMLVGIKAGDDPHVEAASKKWPLGVSLIRQALDQLPLRVYTGRRSEPFSPAFLPESLARRVGATYPDLVHLHWVGNGFLRIQSLRKFNRPLLWTLHDSWPFTGGCHLPSHCTRYMEQCGKCPLLGSKKENDLSRRIWQRKQKAWAHLDLTIVSPSRWLADAARSSALFSKRRIEVIPNGVETKTFKPVERKTAREILSLPLDKKLILSGTVNFQGDSNKGYSLLNEAVGRYAARGGEAELLVVGMSAPQRGPEWGLKTRYMGKLNDEISMALLYAAADLFVLPSRQENLPNTIMESLACGTPVAAFGIGGIPEMIDHKENGWLARPYDTEALAEGIRWLLEAYDQKGGREMTREKAVTHYAIERQAEKYVALYNELVNNPVQRSRA